MKTLTSSIAAVLATAILALPSQLLTKENAPAGPDNAKYGEFKSTLNKIKWMDYFDDPDSLRIVGAKILVQGVKDGKNVVKWVEYTTDNSLKIRGMGRQNASMDMTDMTLQPLYAPLPAPSACRGSPDEPVLAVGQESDYDIKWCDNSRPSRPPNNSAKKNYYYLFSSGDYQLVLTLEYDCDDPNDRSEMPQAVINGAC